MGKHSKQCIDALHKKLDMEIAEVCCQAEAGHSRLYGLSNLTDAWRLLGALQEVLLLVFFNYVPQVLKISKDFSTCIFERLPGMHLLLPVRRCRFSICRS